MFERPTTATHTILIGCDHRLSVLEIERAGKPSQGA